MRNTLEDLYYGNIRPNEHQSRPGSSLQEVMATAERCEAELTARLEGQDKDLLLRLLNAENEIGSTLAFENFVLGYRLGVRMLLEALDGGDGSLINLE